MFHHFLCFAVRDGKAEDSRTSTSQSIEPKPFSVMFLPQHESLVVRPPSHLRMAGHPGTTRIR